MSNKRIAFAGYAGSGKTTAAKYLEEQHGFKTLGFATPLYELGEIHGTASLYEWKDLVISWVANNTESILSDRLKMKLAISILDVFYETPRAAGKNRTLLQKVGTEVGRGVDPKLWTKIFERNVATYSPRYHLVNDNLRFANELECCKDLGFTTVFIHVPAEIRAARYEKEYGKPMSKEQLSHSSESELGEVEAGCEFVIDNSIIGVYSSLVNDIEKVIA